MSPRPLPNRETEQAANGAEEAQQEAEAHTEDERPNEHPQLSSQPGWRLHELGTSHGEESDGEPKYEPCSEPRRPAVHATSSPRTCRQEAGGSATDQPREDLEDLKQQQEDDGGNRVPVNRQPAETNGHDWQPNDQQQPEFDGDSDEHRSESEAFMEPSESFHRQPSYD